MNVLSAPRLATIAVIASVLGACTLFVDLDPLNDEKCPDDQKACDGRCVPKADPATGCAGLSCTPCFVPHATANCGPNGECAIAACAENWRNCDNLTDNGCERDLAHDPETCGSCSNECDPVDHGTPGCGNRQCTIGSCDPGFRDCNERINDGCEAELAVSRTNCGDCGNACTGTDECRDGTCVTP